MILKNLAHFLNKSYIRYDDRVIKATVCIMIAIENLHRQRNVKITDSIQSGIVKDIMLSI
jgi:hypothetical protein